MKIEEIELRLREYLREEMEEVSKRTIHKLVKEIWRANLSPKEEEHERS